MPGELSKEEICRYCKANDSVWRFKEFTQDGITVGIPERMFTCGTCGDLQYTYPNIYECGRWKVMLKKVDDHDEGPVIVCEQCKDLTINGAIDRKKEFLRGKQESDE